MHQHRCPNRKRPNPAKRPPALLALLVSSLVVSSLAGACTQRGDLGRHQHPFDHIPSDSHLAYMTVQGHGATQPHAPAYTDSERALRASAARLLTPVHVDPVWSDDRLSLAFRGHAPAVGQRQDAAAYWRRLTRPSGVSQDVVWNRLAADMEADAVTFAQFVAHAREVHAADAARLERGGEPELRAMNARRHENADLIDAVGVALVERLEVYRFAMDSAARDAPSQRRAAAERAHETLAHALVDPATHAQRVSARRVTGF